MGYIATWGPKGFIISPNKIVPLEGLTSSVALKKDSENDTSGTSPSNTKGLELQTISISTTYLRGVGVDPRAQWEEWVSLVGSIYPLYIGEKLFGPDQMKLTQVDLGEIRTDNNGNFIYAKVTMTFEEEPASKTATKKGNSTGSSTATKDKKKALVPTATKEEKAAKKPTSKPVILGRRQLK